MASGRIDAVGTFDGLQARSQDFARLVELGKL
jgi:hypothetical protein